jgi:peptide/nickel transport system permease protein
MLLKSIGSRVFYLIPLLLGVSLVTFLLLNLLPGSAAVAILGDNATPQAVRQLDAQLGLSQPVLVRYVHWLGSALTGNLGNSLLNQQSVSSLLAQRVPITLELVVLSVLVALVLAVPVSVMAAQRRGGIADRLSSLVATIGLSVPNFVLGLLFVLFFAVKLRLLPSSGFTPLSTNVGENLKQMILPTLSLSFVLFATYTRVLTGDMAEEFSTQDYVLTAKAKGVSPSGIAVRHVLRNSLFGLVTVVGVNVGTLLGASVIIENVFSLPGLGQLLVSSIYNRDLTVVEGSVLVMVVAVVVANLAADLFYMVLDPRVRHGKPSN